VHHVEQSTDAVASAVLEAVGPAVQEAVQAVLTELLTNPALREQLQKAASPDPPPPAERTPEGGRGRLAALCRCVFDKLPATEQQAWRSFWADVRKVLTGRTDVSPRP
jgi:hypothetical protein